MVKINSLSTALLAAGLSSVANAHPGEHDMADALAKRNEHAHLIQRGLENCANHPKFLALQRRGQDRRWEKAQRLRQARGIHESTPFKTKRDLAALEAFEKVDHNMTGMGYDESTSPSTLFASYKNASCILTPEITYGPYFVTGEYYRTNVTESQEGVPVHLEYQYIDVSTCDVATGLYLETWQANATGVYSGVVASGNGNNGDSTNLDKTFLRGVTKVDEEGVAYFDTIFAGHYEGRATHIHIIAQQNGTVWDNGTYSGGTISHVGQVFFQEDLKDAVEATYPYNTNDQAYTTNDEDMWAPDEADSSYDPFPDYAYLGEEISDGLLMWISVGINMSAEYTVSAAATLTADGGVTNSDSELSNPSGGSGNGNSTDMGSMPSGTGSAPSGAMSGGAAQSGSFSNGGAAPSGMSMGGQSMGGTAPSGSGSAPDASGMPKSQSSGLVSSSSVAAVGASSASAQSSSSVSKASSSVASVSSTAKAVVNSSKFSSASKSSSKSSSVAKSSSMTSSKKTSTSTHAAQKSSSSVKKISSSTKKASSTKHASSSVKKSTSTKKITSTKKSTKKPTSTKKSTKKATSTKKPANKATSTKKATAKTTAKVTKKVSTSTKKGLTTVTTKKVTSSKKH